MSAEGLLAKAVQATHSASLLLDAGDPDGACNRAYYAMFDAARVALLSRGQPMMSTHKGVLQAFSEHFIKGNVLPKDLGRILKKAETFRYVADYEGDPVDMKDARTMVEQARDFVQSIVSFMAGHPAP